MTLRQLLRYPETRCKQWCGCVLIELFLQKVADGIWPTGLTLLTPDLYLRVVGDYIDLCKKISELYSYNWVFYWMLIMSLLKKESKKSIKRLSQRWGRGEKEEKKIVPQTSGRMLMEWTRVRNPEFIRTFALGCYEGPCVPSHLSLTLPWCEPARGSACSLLQRRFSRTPCQHFRGHVWLPALTWPDRFLESESPAPDHRVHPQTCLAHAAHQSPCEGLETSPTPLPLGRYEWAAFPRIRVWLTLESAHCGLPFAFSCSSSSAIVCS